MKSGHTDVRRRRVSSLDRDGTPPVFHETRRAVAPDARWPE
jgi:hypothetical protein